VILLHGAPACGKLTTARALAEVHPTVILHNHLTFNLAAELFEIGDSRLLDLHRELRLVMLRHALAETPAGAVPVPDITLTLVYSEPETVDSLAEIVALIEAAGADLRPFYLQCNDANLLSRVASDERESEGKLHSAERLSDLLRTHDYPPLPHPKTRIINNDDRSAESVALEIAQNLSVHGNGFPL
jgi:hypothetical protein